MVSIAFCTLNSLTIAVVLFTKEVLEHQIEKIKANEFTNQAIQLVREKQKKQNDNNEKKVSRSLVRLKRVR